MTGQVNWVEIASHVMDLAIAYALALPIGWDRERKERSAGIRTFPLVAIASCGFVLVAIRVLGIESIGQARILEGLAAAGCSDRRAGHARGGNRGVERPAEAPGRRCHAG